MKYTFASLGNMESLGFRIGGPGLGNMLFPWAKSLVYAHNNNSIRIQASWRGLKIGPFLRGEKDKRFYRDLFKENEGISGIRKFFLLNFSNNICVFDSMDGLFEDLLTEQKMVTSNLLSITQDKHLEAIKKYDINSIAVHIRLGDFLEDPKEKKLRRGMWNYRIPIKWYIEMINKIRQYSFLPVHVFSDGSDQELSEILSLKNLKRVHYGSAISDMIALSRSKVLISSASTFSMWASFIGQLPTIWFPNQHRQEIVKNQKIFEGEIDYKDSLSPELISNLIDA